MLKSNYLAVLIPALIASLGVIAFCLKYFFENKNRTFSYEKIDDVNCDKLKIEAKIERTLNEQVIKNEKYAEVMSGGIKLLTGDLVSVSITDNNCDTSSTSRRCNRIVDDFGYIEVPEYDSI